MASSRVLTLQKLLRRRRRRRNRKKRLRRSQNQKLRLRQRLRKAQLPEATTAKAALHKNPKRKADSFPTYSAKTNSHTRVQPGYGWLCPLHLATPHTLHALEVFALS